MRKAIALIVLVFLCLGHPAIAEDKAPPERPGLALFLVNTQVGQLVGMPKGDFAKLMEYVRKIEKRAGIVHEEPEPEEPAD